MMVKMGLTPEYECISQTGPQHQAMFDYRCVAFGLVVTASARSKKEAKQEVARLMLQQLSCRGHAVPPPYGAPAAAASMHADPSTHGMAPVDARSYVALLRELCEEYRLAGVEYELVGDTGPPHLRHFTVRARIGQHQRQATATTKKTARQHAAEQLYCYLRENLARVTRDFNEEDALVRAHEKAMERYSDAGEDAPRRPDLGQKVSEYHLGLTSRLDAEALATALGALERAAGLDAASALAELAAALHVRVEPATLGALHVLTLTGSSPDLTFAGRSANQAAQAALDYVRRALLFESPRATATAAAATAAAATALADEAKSL
ncbi:hypothetical protein PYW07_016269 [Mythimna separata]|uniref:DRBM domain-containing protein n=1 Tax=Mythimna separata TaxID=271217 RepID=A0AAD7YT17_MYTSE|nr:hypothetical protein PYW07_016269 [Mythimna separata]